MKKVIILLFFGLIVLSNVNYAFSETINLKLIIQPNNCTLYFKQGWNFFSICSELQNERIEDVFSSISDKYRYLMRWNLSDQKFDIYSAKSANPPFTKINNNESYFIYVYNNLIINFSGKEEESGERYLVQGWAAPSYPYRLTRLITEIYNSILGNLRYIMKWDSNTQEFKIYSPKSNQNPFEEINLGEGQLIYMENPQILYYSK